MTTEYGIFSEEGLLEGDFYTVESAQAELELDYAEDGAHVAEICPEHREHEREHCEVCAEIEAAQEKVEESLCWTEGPCSCHSDGRDPEEE